MRKFAVLGMAARARRRPLGVLQQQQDRASDTRHPQPRHRARRPRECGNTPKPAAAANFKPVKADTLSVVTSLPGPGFWEGSDSDPTKLTSGYEYDIAKCMQSSSGSRSFSVRNVSFDAIVAGTVPELRHRTVAGLDHTRPGEGRLVLEPYFESQQGILMKSDKSITHARRGQEPQLGRADRDHRRHAAEEHRRQQPAHVHDLTDAYTALEAGQVDAVLIDTAINLGEAARSNGKFHVVAQFDQPGGPDQYGAILPKGSANVAPVERRVRRP